MRKHGRRLNEELRGKEMDFKVNSSIGSRFVIGARANDLKRIIHITRITSRITFSRKIRKEK